MPEAFAAFGNRRNTDFEMRLILIAILGVAAVGIGGVAWASGSEASATKPGLLIQETNPLTVIGLGFDPAEHVTLTVRPGMAFNSTKAAERVARTAAGNGKFVAVFQGVSVSDCQGYAVTAVGSDGNRASVGRRPGVCAPGPADG
jgi:hypothetical protein